MTNRQEQAVRDRLVSIITDTNTSVDKLPKMVNTLLNLEQCVHEIKMNPVKKSKKEIGIK